jgi:hypothetical protein
MKIAFDLDGVLVPDYNRIPDLSEAEFFEQTLYAKPLFNPEGEFDVVTARLDYNRGVTEAWLAQLTTQPVQLLMRDSEDESPAAFKYRMIKQHGYTLYVESDPHICREIYEHSIADGNETLHVLHFDAFINHAIVKNFRNKS